MPSTKCGFDNNPAGAPGPILLVLHGPTLLVNIGFDEDYQPATQVLPRPGLTDVRALVDTGASASCIDSGLAADLALPVVDRRRIGGVGGEHEVNVHLAQIHVPTLLFTIYGRFFGVHLEAGGQSHRALLGRDFLYRFLMVYEGHTGTVTISTTPAPEGGAT